MTEPVPSLDFDELEAAMRRGGRPTDDDVTILRDGTRLDTPEKVRAWVDETVRRNLATMKAEAAESST